MADTPKKPPRFPHPVADDEVVEIPPTERSERLPRVPPHEPFKKLVTPPGETIGEVLRIQRKMALQLDGFGQMVNRRFDIFHEELSMLRQTVTADHAPRLEKVEASLGQKVAKGGGIVGLIVVALPLLSEVLPKWAKVFEQIGSLLQ